MRVWNLLVLMVCFAPTAMAQLVDSINYPPQWMVWNTQNSNIPYDFVTDLDIDSKGNVWMGFCTPFSGGGGFGRFTMPNDWLHFDRNNFPIFSNRIEFECVACVQVNLNDTVYVNLNNSSVVNIVYDYVHESSHECEPFVSQIYRLYVKEGLVYAVLRDGMYSFNDSCHTFIRYSDPNTGPKRIFSLAFDRNDKMYIGTELRGIFYYENGAFIRLEMPDSVFDEGSGRVSSLLFETTITGNDTIDKLWFGFGSSLEKWAGVGVWTKDTVYMYRKADLGTNTGAVLWLERDRRGRIWVGTRDGLAIFDKGRWTAYNYGSSFIPHPMAIKFVFDKRGNAWIATYGGGLAAFNPEGLWFGEPTELFQKNDITLYPVPTTNELNMRFMAEKDGKLEVFIRDTYGRELRYYPQYQVLHGSNELQFDLTGLPAGLLLLEVQTPTQTFFYKTIKL